LDPTSTWIHRDFWGTTEETERRVASQRVASNGCFFSVSVPRTVSVFGQLHGDLGDFAPHETLLQWGFQQQFRC
jgi:hypothetical protein